mgnify:FL=1
MQEIQNAQKEDPDIGSVYEWIDQDQPPSNAQLLANSPEAKQLWLLQSQLSIRNGLLHYKIEGNIPKFCLVVPRKLRKEILHLCHDVRFSGHLGEVKTLAKVKEAFYWPRMSSDVVEYVKTCVTCSKNKKPSQQWPKASLGVYFAGAPLERVHIDILGPLV